MGELFQMGKYGAYVWSSYGLAFVVMSYVAIKPMIDKKSILKQLMMKYRRETQQQNKKQENS